MKRIITMAVIALLSIVGAMAQNANRKGFFIELQGGAAIGDVVTADDYFYKYDISPIKDLTYLKGGFAGSLDFGYRFRLSNMFAFEAKAGLWANFADFLTTWNVRIMPGIRWTSKDFAGNMSAFLAYNVGVGFSAVESSDSYDHMTTSLNYVIPSELGAGINVTPKFYIGLVWNINVYIDPWDRAKYIYIKTNDGTNEKIGDYELYPKTYNTLALRLGYRF